MSEPASAPGDDDELDHWSLPPAPKTPREIEEEDLGSGSPSAPPTIFETSPRTELPPVTIGGVEVGVDIYGSPPGGINGGGIHLGIPFE